MTAKQLIEAEFEDIELQDLAAAFVEEEVGQYDWFNNLKAVKEKLGDKGLRYAIRLWMEETGRTGDATKVAQELDRLAKELPTAEWQQLISPRFPVPSRETFRNPRAVPQVPPGAPQLKIPPQPLGGAVSPMSQTRALAPPQTPGSSFP
jgi:hypothetical protein